jgi:hypothetical protein
MSLLKSCWTVILTWCFALVTAFTSLSCQNAWSLFFSLSSLPLTHKSFTCYCRTMLKHISWRFCSHFFVWLKLQLVAFQHIPSVVLKQFSVSLSCSIIWQVRNLLDERSIYMPYISLVTVGSSCLVSLFRSLSYVQNLTVDLSNRVHTRTFSRFWPRKSFL